MNNETGSDNVVQLPKRKPFKAGKELEFTTVAGFPATVWMNNHGYRCGYVGVPKSHPLYGLHYTERSKWLETPWKETVSKRGILAIIAANFDVDKHGGKIDIVFDVHGGITFSDFASESNIEDAPSFPSDIPDHWWFGFDCAHIWDAPAPEFLDSLTPELRNLHSYRCGEHRNQKFVVLECELLASQLRYRLRHPWLRAIDRVISNMKAWIKGVTNQ